MLLLLLLLGRNRFRRQRETSNRGKTGRNVLARNHPTLARPGRLLSLRHNLHHRNSPNVPSAQMVLRHHSIHPRSLPRFLQRIWRRPYRHQHGLQLRKGCPLHPSRHQPQTRRPNCRPCRMRPNQIRCLCRLHSDAGFQDSPFDLHFP